MALFCIWPNCSTNLDSRGLFFLWVFTSSLGVNICMDRTCKLCTHDFHYRKIFSLFIRYLSELTFGLRKIENSELYICKGILPLTIILTNDDTWDSVELMLPTSVKYRLSFVVMMEGDGRPPLVEKLSAGGFFLFYSIYLFIIFWVIGTPHY
jgi:hypothetical protein